jgi:hypothetical protein
MNSAASPKSILALLCPWSKAHLVEQAGGEVARECRAELWCRIARQISGMSVPEIRGYVRAHAAGIAASQLGQVLVRRALKPSLGVRVLASSIDQLVSMVVHDALAEELPGDARTLAA